MAQVTDHVTIKMASKGVIILLSYLFIVLHGCHGRKHSSEQAYHLCTLIRGTKTLDCTNVPFQSYQMCDDPDLGIRWNVKELIMKNNGLQSIDHPACWQHFPELEILRIEDNNISAIHRNAFVGLGELEKLCISKTNLKVFPMDLVQPLNHLKELCLKNSQLVCNCMNAWLWDHLYPRKKNKLVLTSETLQCRFKDVMNPVEIRTLLREDLCSVRLINIEKQHWFKKAKVDVHSSREILHALGPHETRRTLHHVLLYILTSILLAMLTYIWIYRTNIFNNNADNKQGDEIDDEKGSTSHSSGIGSSFKGFFHPKHKGKFIPRRPKDSFLLRQYRKLSLINEEEDDGYELQNLFPAIDEEVKGHNSDDRNGEHLYVKIQETLSSNPRPSVQQKSKPVEEQGILEKSIQFTMTSFNYMSYVIGGLLQRRPAIPRRFDHLVVQPEPTYIDANTLEAYKGVIKQGTNQNMQESSHDQVSSDEEEIYMVV